MPTLEKLDAAASELEDLLDFYEDDQIERQASFSSSEPIPEEKVLPTHLRNGLDKLLMIVEQVENKRQQSIKSKTGTSQPQADTITPTMELAEKVGTVLALSGLFRVVRILDKNFSGIITAEEMKPLNDFTECKIEALIREAKSDDLVQLMPLLEELQAAAFELEDLLDLYEYEQIEKQIDSSSSSSDEPIAEEKVLPAHLGDGLDKLLTVVERVETIRRSITSKTDTTKPQHGTITPAASTLLSPSFGQENQRDSFTDFLVGEYHVARPVIKLAVSDVSRVIEMLGSNFGSDLGYNSQLILQQLKDVVGYHLQALMEYVNSNDLARSMQLQDMLQAASLQLFCFGPDIYFCGCTDEDSPYYFNPLKKEESGPILPKSPLRIGLEILMKYLEQVENKHSTETIAPTLRSGVEKWLKFVEQMENEHQFIPSGEDATCPRANTTPPMSMTFFPGRGIFSTMSLENDKCQEDAEEIMRNHKNNLKELSFGWTDVASSTDTCKEVLERLEPDQNLENLSIMSYSCSKFPNWMEKENRFPRLRKLTLWSCTSLKIVPFLPPCLQRLEVYDCHELMQLPPLSDTLHTLRVSSCPKLPALANLSDTVTELWILDCPKLTSLGNLQRCTSVKHLVIYKCPMLRREEASSIEGVVGGDIASILSHVEQIKTDAPSLVLELVKQQAFSSIKRLVLIDCAALPNLDKFSSLYYLYINQCPDVELLPNLPVSLRSLYVAGCPKLKEKYEEGGPLRNTISHISHIDIS